MEFEEIKKIWDTQSNKNYYAIDEEAMHKRVMKKNIEVKRMSSVDEWGLIIISLFLVGFMIYKAIAFNQPHKFASSVIFLLVAGYLYWDRKKRIKNDGTSDNTVLSDLEQAIRTIDYYIRKQQNFIWWFVLPAAISMVINLSFQSQGAIWRIPVVIAAILLGLFVVHLSLKYFVLPKKRNLESLRKTLLNSE